MNVGIGGVRRGVSEFLQVVYTKPLDICYDFAAVLNYDYPLLGKVSARHSEASPFWGALTPEARLAAPYSNHDKYCPTENKLVLLFNTNFLELY